MKKKVNVFGKTVPVFVLVLLGIGLVSAALIASWGTITGSVIVSQGLSWDGAEWDATLVFLFDGATMTSLNEETFSSPHYLKNDATDVDAEFDLVTTCADSSAVDCSTDVNWYYEYKLFADGAQGTEDRVTILVSEVTGVDTLNDLDSIEWDVNVLGGYIAHVDVLLDINDDGVYTPGTDDALVFEYANLDEGCDNSGGYPTGEQDTFGTKGVVDSNAHAWLTSGPPGPCSADPTVFFRHTLSEWIAGPNSNEANGKTISGATKVLRFEIEVDNWIEESESKVSHIEINDVEYEVSGLKADYQLDFDFNVEFPKMLVPDTYTITTKVMPVA